VNEVKTYIIESHYFEDEWITDSEIVEGTFAACGSLASKIAKRLDGLYGDSHYWNVKMFTNPKNEYGAFFELFHGRTS
jgi:hypothetical protein